MYTWCIVHTSLTCGWCVSNHVHYMVVVCTPVWMSCSSNRKRISLSTQINKNKLNYFRVKGRHAVWTCVVVSCFYSCFIYCVLPNHNQDHHNVRTTHSHTCSQSLLHLCAHQLISFLFSFMHAMIYSQHWIIGKAQWMQCQEEAKPGDMMYMEYSATTRPQHPLFKTPKIVAILLTGYHWFISSRQMQTFRFNAPKLLWHIQWHNN